MKKLLLIMGILMIAYGAYGLIFDDKDHCLDYGGSYNEQTKQCEK
ncbi:hypothetical protein ACKLNO_08540 [Neisseriaceae bacterium B1]